MRDRKRERERESSPLDGDESSPPGSVVTTPEAVASVPQLEMLMRLHVMMGELIGGRSTKHKDICLQALGYCLLLWKVAWHM